LPDLTLNCNPPDLHLPSNWDYRHEPPYWGWGTNLWSSCVRRYSSAPDCLQNKPILQWIRSRFTAPWCVLSSLMRLHTSFRRAIINVPTSMAACYHLSREECPSISVRTLSILHCPAQTPLTPWNTPITLVRTSHSPPTAPQLLSVV
jgi:hypothetical protein